MASKRNRKNKRKIKILLFVLLFFVLTLAVIFGGRELYRFYLESKYPLIHRDLVAEASETYSIPPEKIYAVIKAESGFREDAVSSAGAVGLMQLLPTTAEWLCQKRGIEFRPEMLKDPVFNIDLGCFYLSELYQRFSDWELAHAAYNAGPNTVLRWMEDPDLFQNGKLVSVPFPETRSYLERIRDYEEEYTNLYQKKG